MSFGPKGGPAGVPYNREMREAFTDEMRIAAQALERDREKEKRNVSTGTVGMDESRVADSAAPDADVVAVRPDCDRGEEMSDMDECQAQENERLRQPPASDSLAAKDAEIIELRSRLEHNRLNYSEAEKECERLREELNAVHVAKFNYEEQVASLRAQLVSARKAVEEMESHRLVLAWIAGQSTDPKSRELANDALGCAQSDEQGSGE